MIKESHVKVTETAFDLLAELDEDFALKYDRDTVASVAWITDIQEDVEFVDVEGGIGSGGRDNPHKDETWADDDVPHKQAYGYNFTAWNHFIDIKKGPGIFDDYDGYSYQKGSAKNQQYQKAEDATDNQLIALLAFLTGKKVDEGVNWWFNDEYVHVKGRKWYKDCSPAMERYSFYQDKGVYDSLTNELKARFPLAESTGGSGKGIPYSVFMPVDNLARYWYGEYERTMEPAYLGFVMHAIQDASVPHHAAGYLGNWHGEYEKALDGIIQSNLDNPFERNSIKGFFNVWNSEGTDPPTSLAASDWGKVPHKNWRLDMLVTWMALNAYHAYASVYNNFSGGYDLDAANARWLINLSTAMCMLVLNNAAEMKSSTSFSPIEGMKIVKAGSSYYLEVGSRRLTPMTSQSASKEAKKAIEYYGMNQVLTIGRPQPALAILLADGHAPEGEYPGEKSINFSPAHLKVKRVEDKVTGKAQWAVLYGDKEVIQLKQPYLAQKAIEVIKKYGFTHVCTVGTPKPVLTYFRK